MLGILMLGAFLALGIVCAQALFGRLNAQARSLFGCALGLMMMMWLPSLFAFGVGFTMGAQLFALLTAALLAALARLIPRRLTLPSDDAHDQDGPPLWLTLVLVVPFFLLSCYLMYTHVLRPEGGALHVGQSTYGDLSLHLGIATGLRGASYPPEYTLLPGTTLGYPFLFDALSASMLTLGTPLAWSFIVPGALAMGLVFWGFVLFAWELTRDAQAVAIAYLLTFLNGGLGFAYVLDGWPSNGMALREMMEGFYRAPANMPDLNLRWVNVVCDMMIPQRTLLAGWVLLMPALIMLARAIRTEDRFWFVCLGAWAGALPMVHTHSFLALGLISLGAMLASLKGARNRGRLLMSFVIYGALATLLALPQLLLWTVPQTLGGGVLRPWFNWVNRTESGFIDGYFWFWIKNVGPVYLLMLPAALNAPRRVKPLTVGALVLYAVAELVLFQQNEYDNNKLFYVAFLVMMPLVGRFLSLMWDRMHGVRARALLAAAFMAACLMSGAMTVAREAVSDYQLFSEGETRAAAYVDAHAFPDAVFLTGTQHNNAAAALAGRKIVCGTGSYLFYHGVGYQAQREAARDMFERPADSRALLDRYAVDYIYLSDNEKAEFFVDEAMLRALFPLWHEEDGVVILAASARARAQRAQDKLGENVAGAATFGAPRAS
ncbi:hypothetical protein ACH6CV_02260 [Bacillota bacterium Meth-B3]|nr:hypothetical protein [Christensenellaceae bacterium]MEA5064828.1 hypothetical protein [Eubacteriales bacterium]